VSAADVQSALFTTEWHLDLEPSIDDPVNDTGLGSRRGDLQLSDEFSCLIRLICEASGEFS